MRGAFVARFGGTSNDRLLERVAEAHRWHPGAPEYYVGHGLSAAVLADPDTGPVVDICDERILLVHGSQARSLADLERDGDRFAAVECDGRELVAARDPMGLCPLFYRLAHGALWLSTEVAPLVALAEATPDLLALSAQAALVPEDARTGWNGIFRILPGCSLHATADLQLRSRRYWEPAKLLRSYRGSREDAEAQLRARLLAAVDRCTGRGTGILVSGGLDSTAIVVAAKARADWLVHVAFSGFEDSDEERYARAVADSVEGDLDVVPGELTRWDPQDDLLTANVPYLTPPNLTANTGLARLAKLGASVALDGNDGDGVLGYPGHEWGELMLTRRFGRVAELAAKYGREPVIQGVADALIPPVLRLRTLRGRPPQPQTYFQRTARYFAEPLRRRMRQTEMEGWRSPFGEWGRRQLRQVLPVSTIRMEEHELRGARFGLDVRHPFADRELVEFLISLPADVKSDPFRSKALLRDALGGMTSSDVLERAGKASYFDVLRRRVDPARCLDLIKASAIELPLVNYDLVYQDAAVAQGPPLFLLLLLARAHAFAAGVQAV